jgi:cysteine synthase B
MAAVGDRLTHFITGIGTSGTVMGTSRYLKEKKPSVRTVALEPDDALHGLEGLKHMASSIIPPIWRPEECIDEIMPMSTDEGWDCAERVAHDEGLFIGHSAGGAVAGALRLARAVPEGQDACIVTVLADLGDRYFRPLKWEKHYVW